MYLPLWGCEKQSVDSPRGASIFAIRAGNVKGYIQYVTGGGGRGGPKIDDFIECFK